MVRLEGAVRVDELGVDLPEGLGDVGAALELALDDQAEGRALHAADGEEVGAEAAGREGDGAGQGRAPDEVDLLPHLGGVGERVGEVVELVEGTLDLVLGERRVAGAQNVGAGGPVAVEAAVGELRVDVERLAERLEADQLTLAVEVGRDHDRVGLLGELADRLDDVLVGRLLDELRVDQRLRVGLLPVRVALGEGGIEHVALEADGGVLAARVAPRVVGRLV